MTSPLNELLRHRHRGTELEPHVKTTAEITTWLDDHFEQLSQGSCVDCSFPTHYTERVYQRQAHPSREAQIISIVIGKILNFLCCCA